MGVPLISNALFCSDVRVAKKAATTVHSALCCAHSVLFSIFSPNFVLAEMWISNRIQCVRRSPFTLSPWHSTGSRWHSRCVGKCTNAPKILFRAVRGALRLNLHVVNVDAFGQMFSSYGTSGLFSFFFYFGFGNGDTKPKHYAHSITTVAHTLAQRCVVVGAPNVCKSSEM